MRSSIFLFALIFVWGSIAAQSNRTLKALSAKYIDAQKYDKALGYLVRYQQANPKDLQTKYNLGVCYYQLGQADEALKFFSYVEKSRIRPFTSRLYLYIAKSNHRLMKFSDAIEYYKKYLGQKKLSDNERQLVKDEINRCISGIGLEFSGRVSEVENMGNNINTLANEYAPVIAVDDGYLLFFASDREGSLGGATDEMGNRDTLYGRIPTDIYKSSNPSGEWTYAEWGGSKLNTTGWDIPQDFSSEQDNFIISRGINSSSLELFTNNYYDTTQVQGTGTKMPEPLNGAEQNITDLYLFNDTIALFSAIIPEGFGNKDLYFSVRNTEGRWSVPKNLGATINGLYDEVSPFLSRNGRILYFASNNLNSMGGFDIFRSVFIDSSRTWTTPENMGTPINSGADDSYFRLGDEGLQAYFTSNRPGGQGRNDIYAAYFVKYLAEQINFFYPASFVDVLNTPLSTTPKPPTNSIGIPSPTPPPSTSQPQQPEQPKKTVKITPVYYNAEGAVDKSGEVSKINTLSSLLTAYPQVRVEIWGHADNNITRENALYFSMKYALNVANMLVQAGVKPEQISVKGVGNQYPIHKYLDAANQPYAQAGNLNRRFDFRIFNTEGTNVTIEYVNPAIDVAAQDKKFEQHLAAIKGLTYKIQIKAAKQRYDSPLLQSSVNTLIEATPNGDYQRYTIGIFSTLAEAEKFRLKVVPTESFVVAYIHGVRITKEQAYQYIQQYPDLKNWSK